MKKTSILFLLFGCLFLSISVSHAQPINFRNFQVDQGLSNNSVLSLLCDSKGFIWIGTRDGLNKFDGRMFTIYRSSSTEQNGLLNSTIVSLHEAANGAIWVGTEKGIFIYDYSRDRFDSLPGVPHEPVRCIQSDSAGNVWFVGGFVLYHYNWKTGILKEVPQLQPRRMVTEAYLDDLGFLWIGTIDGNLGKWSTSGDKPIQFLSLFSHSPDPISYSIETLAEENSDFIFAGTVSEGLKRINRKTLEYEDIHLPTVKSNGFFVRDILKIDSGYFWIATESGLITYNKTTGKVDQNTKSFNDPYTIADNAVYCFARDKQNGIWLGTYFGGVHHFAQQPLRFELFFPKAGENSLPGNAVRELANDHKGNVWIGTEDGGLSRFGVKTKRFKNYIHIPTGISTSNIHGLALDGEYLWIGTFERGIDLFNTKTEKVEKHFNAVAAGTQLNSNFGHSVFKTSTGEILLGTSNGFYYYDKAINDFKVKNNLPFDNFYSCIMEDKSGTIWIGTYRTGIYFIPPGASGYNTIRLPSGSYDDLLRETRILDIVEGNDGSMWIGTESGLFKINKSKTTYNRYYLKNGFPSNVIYKILEDNNRMLWITTSNGLVRFDPLTEKLYHFTKSQGLLTNQFNFSSGLIDDEGYFYFGSVKGLIRFKPGDFEPNTFEAPLFYTQLRVNNLLISPNSSNSPLKKSMWVSDTILLGPNSTTFSLSVATLDYLLPENIHYAYRVKELGDDWNDLQQDNRISFTDLPPGTYHITARSTNSAGNWLNNEKTLVVVVEPAWWESNLAKVIYVLLLIAAVGLVFREYHLRIARRQERIMEKYAIEKQKELYEAKIDFFTKVAHEIRTPLTLIKAPLEKVMKLLVNQPQAQKHLQTMDKNTERLIFLTGQLMDFRKMEKDQFSLHMEELNFVEVVNSVWEDFQSLAETEKITFRLSPNRKPIIMKADKEALNKIISNLLDNAIKYGEHTVTTSVLDKRIAVELSVQSGGKAIDQEFAEHIFEPFYRLKDSGHRKGNGIGLSLARSLAELHNGRLELETGDSYNIFILTLPKQPVNGGADN